MATAFTVNLNPILRISKGGTSRRYNPYANVVTSDLLDPYYDQGGLDQSGTLAIDGIATLSNSLPGADTTTGGGANDTLRFDAPPAAGNMASTVYANAPWSYPDVPNFQGQLLASDPAIMVDGGIFRMFYTAGFDDGMTVRPVIAEAVSADGLTWTPLGGTSATGIVLAGEGGDKANLEGAEIFKAGDKYILLYSTYPDIGKPVPQFPASLYAAVSSDGLHFTPVAAGPVLQPTAGWYDNDAIFSPTVLPYQGGYLMLYCAHAYTDASAGGHLGVSLLAAVSTDGLNWTKSPAPILRADPSISWMADGVAEPSMILGPDGKYYLFFTGLDGEERVIGLAVATNPLGPWEIAPQPIITAQSAGLAPGGTVIAPHAELVSGVLRLWYTEVTPDDAHTIAYAESNWGGGASPGLGQAPLWLGTSLDDVIAGTDGNDRVTAEGGNDTVTGAGGNDSIDAGPGNDQVSSGSGNDTVLGRSGNDVLYMGDGADTANGGAGADVLFGEAGIDRLLGNVGKDMLDGGADADTLDGGADNDQIWAGLGDDYATGGVGDDLLYMGDGADTSDGGDGSDIINGEAGRDLLRGGAGNDTLDGGADADTLDGGADNDQIWAGLGDDYATGGLGDDLLYMGDGADTADGDDGADIITGEAGQDLLRGGTGNDTLDGGADADALDGGSGNDILYGGTANDRLLGGAGADLLVGEDGNDTLIGGSGGDTLTGGIGDDTLAGGAGSDQLQGDAGRDAFLFDAALNPSTNLDRLLGFTPVDDTIQLENAIFAGLGPISGALAPAAFRAAAGATSARDATDRIVYDTLTGFLYYDPDGIGGTNSIGFAVVENRAILTANDFSIV